MLVLSRKRGEQLVIGDEITVTVVECNGSRIKIGIEAPNEIRIVRSELNAVGAYRSVPGEFGYIDEFESMLMGNPR